MPLTNKKVLTILTTFGILIGLFSCHSSRKKFRNNGFGITGQVLRQQVYCGGSRPTQEMIEKLAIPVPYPNKTFYIQKGRTIKGKSSILTSFTTDERGVFNIYLPPGTYSIVLEEQLQPFEYELIKNKNVTIDERCLAEWRKKPYYILQVQGFAPPPLEFIFTQRCFLNTDIPCVTYSGPLPH